MYIIQDVKRILNIATNTDGRFFVLIEANDNKTYQVKFNVLKQKSNINELISNFIGKLMNAPVLDASFLSFTKEQIDSIYFKLQEKNPQNPIFPDMSNIKNYTFFGIEWQNSLITLQTNSELEILLEKVNNKKDFFSLYPYDQYLKNYDRHIGNHLILKDNKNKPSQYCLIDGDRIFGSLDWSLIDTLISNFSCMETSGVNWHQYLYSLVNEESYIFVLESSLEIDNITEEKLKLMMELISYIYTIDKNEYDKILGYLTFRKKDFYQVCLKNATCFPKIEQSRIL
ncbi:hypothetical protein [Aliarcobacter butzleri]|uniref:hypothetical protein n=1 Tax=Aliarcobacter butzleri TaxID=28197 RepID=UPI001EDC54EF|nr:hypothetical protein [Aliarcobacter butzleri]MCG3671959.1 hypothetical protein [Aliarcobacter butzleri]